jgi:hypothetical protein
VIAFEHRLAAHRDLHDLRARGAPDEAINEHNACKLLQERLDDAMGHFRTHALQQRSFDRIEVRLAIRRRACAGTSLKPPVPARGWPHRRTWRVRRCGPILSMVRFLQDCIKVFGQAVDLLDV